MHPIVEQMQPSREQAPAVRERGRDVVVTAGAGTGKTRTLVARYLALVAEGLPLRTTVAITFTRKAAREMRNRVRHEIHLYLGRPDLPEVERRRWQSLYAELDAARIGTIHSLCSEILRAHPAEAGVDPRFEVLDEGRGNVLLGQVVDGALAWAADNEDLVGLYPLLGESRLRSTLATMVGKRLEVETCLANQPPPLWPVWESRL
ncbi:MAG: UvrD-helicase domain-containing protein, partial [Anaerolineae bacterium]